VALLQRFAESWLGTRAPRPECDAAAAIPLPGKRLWPLVRVAATTRAKAPFLYETRILELGKGVARAECHGPGEDID